MPNLFRIHIRPVGGRDGATRSFEYCCQEKVLGVGWQVEFPEGSDRSWESYKSLAGAKYGASRLSRVQFLHDNVQRDDLIWTRDSRGSYFLARVCSPWEYHEAPGSAAADVVNVVRCHIHPVECIDDVPGEVVNCFRARRAIQRIRKATAVAYSKLLWNRLSKSEDYETVRGQLRDLFSYLAPEAIEDVIFIYLQTCGWLVIPHSRKADTMDYEFVLIHAQSKKRGIVQVKTGQTSLNREDWKGKADEVFLFQTNGVYTGTEMTGVTCIDASHLCRFITENKEIMPRAVQRWADHLGCPSQRCSDTAVTAKG